MFKKIKDCCGGLLAVDLNTKLHGTIMGTDFSQA